MTYGERATSMPTGRPPDPPPSHRTTTREEGRTMDTGYDYAQSARADAESVKPLGIIEDLDQELARLDELAANLQMRLAPVSNQYNANKVSEDTPRPEPSSELRGRIERLRGLCARLDRIYRDIEL